MLSENIKRIYAGNQEIAFINPDRAIYNKYGNKVAYKWEFNGDFPTKFPNYHEFCNLDENVDIINTEINIPIDGLYKLIFVGGGSTGNYSRQKYRTSYYVVNGASGACFVGILKLTAGKYPLTLAGNVAYTVPKGNAAKNLTYGISGFPSSFAGITLTAATYGYVYCGDDYFYQSNKTAEGGKVEIEDPSIIVREILKADGNNGDNPNKGSSLSEKYAPIYDYYDIYNIRYHGCGARAYINNKYMKSGPGYFKLEWIKDL